MLRTGWLALCPKRVLLGGRWLYTGDVVTANVPMEMSRWAKAKVHNKNEGSMITNA